MPISRTGSKNYLNKTGPENKKLSRQNCTVKTATWITRSVKDKVNEIMEEFEKLNLNILVIAETKKKGKGEIETEGGHTMLYSGVPQEQNAKAGVACIINKKLVKDIIQWEGVNERILKVEMRQENDKQTIIAAYGPDENEVAEIKDKFWHDLNVVTEECKDKIFVIGDLNARVGKRSRTNTYVLGNTVKIF